MMNRSLRLLPVATLLALSSCAGVGNYLHSTFTPFGTPNAPQGDELNMQRARGDEASVQPILPQSGDIWPGPAAKVPTLGQVEQNMNGPPAPATGNPHVRNGIAGFVPPSTPPGSNQPTVPNAPRRVRPPKISTPVIGTGKSSFAVGQTLISPNGPVGVVTGNNGRYMTVAPTNNGQGGGMLIPGTGSTATLIGPNGQVTTVTGARP